MVEHVSCTRSFCKTAIHENFFFPLLRIPLFGSDRRTAFLVGHHKVCKPERPAPNRISWDFAETQSSMMLKTRRVPIPFFFFLLFRCPRPVVDGQLRAVTGQPFVASPPPSVGCPPPSGDQSTAVGGLLVFCSPRNHTPRVCLPFCLFLVEERPDPGLLQFRSSAFSWGGGPAGVLVCPLQTISVDSQARTHALWVGLRAVFGTFGRTPVSSSSAPPSPPPKREI